MDIKDKVFVVTGGGNGIGREVVRSLLTNGARVAALDVSESGLSETADLAKAGDRLTTHTVDITDREAVAALAEQVVETHGQVDGLLNVAGIIQHFVPVAELGADEIEHVMAVNFWGTVNTTKAFLPLLLKRPEAALVNVSSMGALVPVPGQSAYGASKAAVKLFTEGMFAELHDSPVNVSVVFPGGVSTHIMDNSGVEMANQNLDEEKTRAKLTTPEDAALQIVKAVENGTPRVLIGNDAKLLDKLSRALPTRAILLVAKKMQDLMG